MRQKRQRMLAIKIRRLRRAELPADTTEMARFLIGKTVVRELRGARLSGRIVEAEAYLHGDAAAHSFRGQTLRNATLFMRRGHAYVYFTYGNHFMLNVSGGREGIGEGVLIRAIEPMEGIEWMERHRGSVPQFDLTRGPGRVAQALRVDKRLDGVDLCARGALWLGTEAREAGKIGESVRIGITRETHRILRFYERGNPHVSGPKRLNR